MKLCGVCGLNERDGRGRCKPCARRRGGEYYARNPERTSIRNVPRTKRKVAEFRALMAEVKAGPCMDCKQLFPPCVMDFDHVRGNKKFQVGKASHRNKIDVLREIEKCDLVCSNCHRIRTANRREPEWLRA